MSDIGYVWWRFRYTRVSIRLLEAVPTATHSAAGLARVSVTTPPIEDTAEAPADPALLAATEKGSASV